MKEVSSAKTKALNTILSDPLAYVIVLAVAGAICVVSGVAILAGAGWAWVTSGVFSIAAAGYITKGLKSDG